METPATIPNVPPTPDDTELRDIRPDLKARLRVALEKRDFHQSKTEEFGAEADDLMRQLDRENARYGGIQRRRLLRGHRSEPLADFVLNTLKGRPMDKEDLRAAAERAGYNVDGRSIHATVVNMTRTGKIKELPNGTFSLPEHKAGVQELVKRTHGES